jgi:hypothetical protein
MNANTIERSETLRDGKFVRTVTGALPASAESLSVNIPIGEVVVYSSRNLQAPRLTTTLSVTAESVGDGRAKLSWKKGKLLVRQTEPNAFELDGRKEEGLDGLTDYFFRGGGHASWGGADSLRVNLGRNDVLELNGEPFEMEAEELSFDVPYITREVEIGIPEGSAMPINLQVDHGSLEVAGLRGDTTIKTGNAEVDIIDHRGKMRVETLSSPITVVEFVGQLDVRGSFWGISAASVAIEDFDGVADIQLLWSRQGALSLREGTYLGSGSKTHMDPRIVPHGAPLREFTRPDISGRERKIEIKRVEKHGGVSSASYAR